MLKETLNNGKLNTFLLSRTDGIGDVMLTLPLAVFLKRLFPGCRVIFLGSSYTRAIVEACTAVDTFVDYTTLSANRASAGKVLAELNADAILHVFPRKEVAWLAKAAGIPLRIGTSHRWFHWFTCNRLLNFRRKGSQLHEAQLNLNLLTPLLGQASIPSVEVLSGVLTLSPSGLLPESVATLIKPDKINIILHPKSKGSAREWGEANFSQLIALLPSDRYSFFITGSAAEGELLSAFLRKHSATVTDLTGKLTLDELITFISRCQALVACSTGPLHIAAALGVPAIGIYPPIRPMHPGRWAPLGRYTKVFVSDGSCNDCRKSKQCHCIESISPNEVAGYIKTVLP